MGRNRGVDRSFRCSGWSQTTDASSAEFAASNGFRDATLTANGVVLHYVSAGDGPPIVLLPGWPETWYAWRRVMPLLARAGRRVLVFDPPGLGESSFLADGKAYDAGSVADLLHVGLKSIRLNQYDLVGHDIGVWLAYADATRHPEAIRHLALLEAALPGVTPDAAFGLAHAPKVFQFYLNAVPELPEILTRGREREFLAWLFRSKAASPNAIDSADLDIYLRSYSDPARMAAGFAYYRAVPADIFQNKTAASLTMPVLALGGEKGVGTTLHDALKGRATRLSGGELARYGHYLPEECPEELTRRLLAFVGEAADRRGVQR